LVTDLRLGVGSGLGVLVDVGVSPIVHPVSAKVVKIAAAVICEFLLISYSEKL
jgi:hypothetical protein